MFLPCLAGVTKVLVGSTVFRPINCHRHFGKRSILTSRSSRKFTVLIRNRLLTLLLRGNLSRSTKYFSLCSTLTKYFNFLMYTCTCINGYIFSRPECAWPSLPTLIFQWPSLFNSKSAIFVSTSLKSGHLLMTSSFSFPAMAVLTGVTSSCWNFQIIKMKQGKIFCK